MTNPWQANQIALKGVRKAVASRLGKSVELIDTWCRLPRSMGGEGEASPTQRVIEMVLAAREAVSPDADAPFLCIASDLGYAPQVRVAVSEKASSLVDVSAAMKEFSDFLAAVAKAFEDGAVTPKELSRIEVEIDEHVAVMLRQRQSVHAALLEMEESSTRERIGPKRSNRLPRYLALRKAVGQ